MQRGESWWDEFFLRMAELVSSASKDPSTRCGAVIVRSDHTVASVGFNGFPKGVLDDERRYLDRDIKLEQVIHAEVNAVLLAREPLEGYTIYTWPPAYGPSCAKCTGVIIQSGIKRVVHKRDDSEFAMRWKESSDIGLRMYAEANVEVVHM